MNLTYNGKSLLIAGGAGFIGSHVVERLLDDSPRSIHILDNFFLGKSENIPESTNNTQIYLHDTDVSNLDNVLGVIESHDIDTVFNLACVPLLTSLQKPAWTYDQNVKLAKTCCELVRKGHANSLVHISTSEVYGDCLQVPMDESHPLNPKTPYAAGKAAADHLVMSYYRTFDINVCIVRPFNNYGPRQNHGKYAALVPLTIKRLSKGKSPVIYGDGHQTRDFVFVEDTANAIASLPQRDEAKGRVVNVSTSKETSIRELVKALCEEMDFSGSIRFEPDRTADVTRHIGDNSQAKRLGWEPEWALEDGLRTTVNWYLENAF